MYTSTVTSKGTITIPAKLRKLIQIKPSDKVSFKLRDSQLIVEKAPGLEDAFGALYNPNIKPLSVDQINKAVARGLFAGKK